MVRSVPNVSSILAEAAAADVQAVLADDTATVVADTAAAGAGSVLLRVGVVRVRHLRHTVNRRSGHMADERRIGGHQRS